MNVLTQLPVWAQALIAAAPWIILVLLAGVLAYRLLLPGDEDES